MAAPSRLAVPRAQKQRFQGRQTRSRVLTGCPNASPAAISNNGNYNDLRRTQGNSGLKAGCNEVVPGRGWGQQRGETARGVPGPKLLCLVKCNQGSLALGAPSFVLQDNQKPVSAVEGGSLTSTDRPPRLLATPVALCARTPTARGLRWWLLTWWWLESHPVLGPAPPPPSPQIMPS